MARTTLAEKNAQLGGGGAQRWQEIGLHLQHGHARRVAAEVHSGNNAAVAGVHRHSNRTQANFEFLIAKSVTVAAHIAQRETNLFRGRNRALRVLREVRAREISVELVLRK